MSATLYNAPRERAKQQKQPNWLQKILSRIRPDTSEAKAETTIDSSLALKYIPYMGYLTLLGALYIFNQYYLERKIAQIGQMKKDMEQLRVDYSTLKYEYILRTRHLELSDKVKKLGLQENDQPIIRIQVKKK